MITETTDPVEEEVVSSWAILILVCLLLTTMFISYFLQLNRVRYIHETVVSIGLVSPLVLC